MDCSVPGNVATDDQFPHAINHLKGTHTMATLESLQAAQATARTNYAAAADALVTAYVELFAVDTAIGNSNIGGQPQPSFGGEGPGVPTHPIAYPNPPAGGRSFGERITTRLRQLLA